MNSLLTWMLNVFQKVNINDPSWSFAESVARGRCVCVSVTDPTERILSLNPNKTTS